jgi:hypothetical protein
MERIDAAADSDGIASEQQTMRERMAALSCETLVRVSMDDRTSS